jgi:hypothetical protein
VNARGGDAMKLALVAAPWTSSTAVARTTRELARHLADHLALDVFVDEPHAGSDYFGWTTRSARTLLPRDYSQVLYGVGDEAQCGFMAPMVREFGGCVLLRDWSLPRLATAAFPELGTGGLRALVRAAREGGLRDAWALRRSRTRPVSDSGCAPRLNRSIVRFADAFFVHEHAMRARILEERNAPTPICVLADDPASGPDAGERAALAVLEAFQRFPAPRAARKAFILERVRAGLRGASDR